MYIFPLKINELQLTSIFYIILAILISLVVAYFQYYYKTKKIPKVTILLFSLKFVSLFLLLLLLINPLIEKKINTNIKPVLTFLVDNSNSIKFFNETENITNILSEFNQNKSLNNKFDFQKFTFGKELTNLDSLSFLENHTNVSEAIFSVNKLNNDKLAPIVLITDGNQTIGNDYEFISSKQAIYPIVMGDTTKYKDLKISKLNVNKYSYIKNKFPVEIILNYEGDENVNSQFSILNKGKTVFRKNVQFSSIKKSITVTANLTSNKEGIQYYTASLSKINNEKNIKNNNKSFSVEVIDQQTKVLLLTSILHPDLGALKKSIESNKQRSVKIIKIDDFKGQVEDYQLVIFYQPNKSFENIINKVKLNNSNYLLISGANTDWNFINQKQLGFNKNAISKTENYGAIYNDAFLTFLQEDIGFNNYPPLIDKFGEIYISKEHQTLVHQNIKGMQTNQPLLVTFDINSQKSGVLFGEGLWKWRAASFLNSNSFIDFDKFFGNLIQFLASNKKRNRLEINAENMYAANSTINISAFYTDKNYLFDARASLEIAITNIKTKEVFKLPFSLVNNSFKTEIENLNSGEYSYKVSVLGQNINKYGRFKITDFNIEEQFTNANVNKLQKLAVKTGGKLFYKNQITEITNELLKNESFYTIQKSTIKEQNLIDWKWILGIVLTLFTLEWFIRKYYGKI